MREGGRETAWIWVLRKSEVSPSNLLGGSIIVQDLEKS